VKFSEESGRDFVVFQSDSSACRKYFLSEVLCNVIKQTVLKVTDSLPNKDRAGQPSVFCIRLFRVDFFCPLR